MPEEVKSRIESEIEVKSYIQNLKYALNKGAKLEFQAKRLVDEKRDEKYTNQYTVDVYKRQGSGKECHYGWQRYWYCVFS